MNNLNRMPANFNVKNRRHPFQVLVRNKPNSSSEFECKIEPESIVYDLFSDSPIKIEGIEGVFPCKAGDNVVLGLSFEQKGVSISSAYIRVGSQKPEENVSEDYYGASRIIRSEHLVASFEQDTESKKPKLNVLQRIYHHISTYGIDQEIFAF